MPPEVPTVICPSCRAELTAGLRFCRMCGFRLGEGVEEYTETRRFDGRVPPPFAPADPSRATQHIGGPYAPPPAAAPAPHAPSRPEGSKAWRWSHLRRPWRMGWVGWVVLSLVLMAVIGGLTNPGPGGGPPSRLEREADGFETADGGGAFLEGLAGPDTSLERAGLLGGDVIVSFDGQPVRGARELRRMMRRTPVGKVVEIAYMREGELRKTTLTVGDPNDYRGREVLAARPGGEGRIGVNVGDRVEVPTLNTHGVELDSVARNGPADLSGLKRGDVVLEFNGKPTRTRGDLRLRIFEAVPGSTAVVKVLRVTELLEIPVRVGRSRDLDDE